MAEPFVQVVVDHVRRAMVPNTLFAQPVQLAPLAPHHLAVVHDTRGRVLIRAPHATGPYVVGVARWQGDRLVEKHAINNSTPNIAQWELVEQVLRPLIPQARQQPVPPGPVDVAPWIDDTPLLREDTDEGKHARLVREGKIATKAAPPPAKLTGALGVADQLLGSKSIIGKIVGGLVLVLVIVFGVGKACIWHSMTRGATVNGGACKFDSECRSGMCRNAACQAPSVRGAACTRDKECASGHCTRPTLEAAKSCE